MVLLCFNSGRWKNLLAALVFLLMVSSWNLARVAQEKELLTVETTPL